MKRAWERWYPVAIGVAAAILYLAFPQSRDYQLPSTATDLWSAIVSIAGIAVGFLATAYSILISINDKPIVTRLKETQYYSQISRYLRSAITWSFFLTIISAGWLIVDISDGSKWTPWHSAGVAAWLLCAVTASLAYFRVVRIFYAILDSLDQTR